MSARVAGRRGRDQAARLFKLVDAGAQAKYLRDVGDYPLLKPKRELELAQEIAASRLQLWEDLLTYPPFTDGIVATIEKMPFRQGLEVSPQEAMVSISQSSKLFRGRETKAHRLAYEADCHTLAVAMSEVDRDGVIADAILADLERATDRTKTVMKFKCPPVGSRPFAEFVPRVRKSSLALRRKKDEFVKANLRLAVKIAYKFSYGALPVQDLIQEANIGLMRAVDRFDPERGFRFSTYSTWWIKHQIRRGIENKAHMIRHPTHLLIDSQRLWKLRQVFRKENGRLPRDEEMVDVSGFSLPKIVKIGQMRLAPPISFDEPISEDDPRTLLDMHPDESDDSLPLVELIELRQMLDRSFEALTVFEVQILRGRFGFDDGESKTLAELGREHDLSRERIRQLQVRALGKLQKYFKRQQLLE